MNEIKTTFEQCCELLENKKFGNIKSVNNHDIGIYIKGICKIDKDECRCFIPDEPKSFMYKKEECKKYYVGGKEYEAD